MSYETQRDRLLKALQGGMWRSMPSLIRRMGGYRLSARVWELRKRGHEIIWRDVHRGHARHTFYRMVK